MKRLIERGLMYGNLLHVSAPALVERYNRALRHLTGKQTALADFHVDISGYSPEIGDELGDHYYLNHNGVNRQFILLSTEQKRAPLLNATFSSSRKILRGFIDANDSQLFALTATDAVAGELVNSVLQIAEPARLFDLHKVEIEADTPGGRLRHSDELAGLVHRFRTKEDGWFDDDLITRMIAVAGRSGDITRNPVQLKSTEFELGNFWTALFDGLYLFKTVTYPAAISVRDASALGPIPIDNAFDLGDRNSIARFLERNGLVEAIVKAPGLDAVAVLRQKLDFIVIDTAAGSGLDLSGLNRSDMRRLARQSADRLPLEYHGLAALLNWAANGGGWPRITSEHPAYFYTLRAADTEDRDLVNMLLAELSPLDLRQLFICHKDLFYRQYAAWPDAKKAFVVEFLVREYQVDKAGARASLFGHEPDMSGETPPDPAAEMVRRVGPWGAVRRG